MVLSRTSLLVKEKDDAESVDLKEDTPKKKKRKRPTSNIERPTSNVEHPTSN
jgi:hypothetical protein